MSFLLNFFWDKPASIEQQIGNLIGDVIFFALVVFFAAQKKARRLP